MSTGDELSGAVIQMGTQVATETLQMIFKILAFLGQTVKEENRLNKQIELEEKKLFMEGKLKGRDLSDIVGGEHSLAELVKTAKGHSEACVPFSDGYTKEEKDFLVSNAKKNYVPIAFQKKNDLYYPVVLQRDKPMLQSFATDLMVQKLAKCEIEKAIKPYKTMGLNKWEVPFMNDYFNKFEVSVQFGQTENGKNFALYSKSDEKVISLARKEFLKHHKEVLDVKIETNEQAYTFKDNKGNELKINKDMLPRQEELAKLIERTLGYEPTKAKMLSARFGESLDEAEKKVFFDKSIIKDFTKFETNIVMQGENPLSRQYDCMRVQPKFDENPKIIFIDEKGNFAILEPERMSNKKMAKILDEELHIKDKKTMDALVQKARLVSLHYNTMEKENKSFSYNLEKSGVYSNPSTKSVDFKIDRESVDKVNVTATATTKDNSTNTTNFTFSLKDKAKSIEELKKYNEKLGLDEFDSNNIAKEVIKRADKQAPQMIQIDSIQAEKYFDSDIPKISTAKATISLGGVEKEISLGDIEKSKSEIIKKFGCDEETATATVEQGRTTMTRPQESKLQEFGYDTEKLEMEDADYLLGEISENHWKIPEGLEPDSYIPFADRTPEIESPKIQLEKDIPDIELDDDNDIGGM